MRDHIYMPSLRQERHPNIPWTYLSPCYPNKKKGSFYINIKNPISQKITRIPNIDPDPRIPDSPLVSVSTQDKRERCMEIGFGSGIFGVGASG